MTANLVSLCTAEGGCGKSVLARGLCGMHYARQRRSGQLERVFRSYGREPRPLSNGYWVIYMPEHPNAHKNGCVPYHRYVMAEHIGRPLRSDESVHHKNGKPGDNSIGNLELRRRHHGMGQVVEDLVADAIEILNLYAPELLAKKLRVVA